MSYDEMNLQIRCVTFLTYRYSDLIWNHSPNEGKRSDKAGNTLKQMGMQKGWPDLEIISRDKTVFIEFKTTKGRQSESQKHIQLMIENAIPNLLHFIVLSVFILHHLCHLVYKLSLTSNHFVQLILNNG